MKFTLVSGSALLGVAFLANAAFAQLPPDPEGGEQSPPPPPPTDPVAAPPPPPPPPPSGSADVGAPANPKAHGMILPNMLPSRLGATIDFRMDYTQFSEGSGLDITMFGFVLHGQYIAPENYGGYVQIPYYYASFGDDGEGGSDSDNGAGNIEIGGLYRLPQGESQEILLRAGVALDTAGQAGGLFAPFSQLGPRFYDAYATGFGATWLRGEGSFRHSAGNLRLAASAGFDVPVGQGDGEDGFTINVDALGKAALSAGIEQPGFGAAIGFVFMAAIGSDDSEDDTAFGLNATVHVPINPSTAIYGAFGWPSIDDDNEDLDIWAVGAGVRAAVF
jgi:hypothetical protein